MLLLQQTYFEKLYNEKAQKFYEIKERLTKSIDRTRVIDTKLTDLLEKNEKMGPNLMLLEKEHHQFQNEIEKNSKFD